MARPHILSAAAWAAFVLRGFGLAAASKQSPLFASVSDLLESASQSVETGVVF